MNLALIGPAIGRFLVRRSRRAHTESGKPADPDALTALIVYLLSRWRHRKFRQMLALQRTGAVIIADRYPQAEVAGFYFDGPGIRRAGSCAGSRRANAGFIAQWRPMCRRC